MSPFWSSRFSLIGAAALLLANPAHAQRPVGTDVSSYQGSSVNWSALKGDGISFGWAKAAEGTATDGYIGQDADFTVNEANARSAGVYLGAYYFARPSADPGTSGADAEAGFYWGIASNYVKTGSTYLVPMLDWEDTSATVAAGFTAASMSAWVNEWCNDISNYARAQGVTLQPVVYTGSWYSEPGSTYPGLNSSVTIWPTWVAAYPSCTTVNGNQECGTTTFETSSPAPAYPWWAWHIWQYGDTNLSGGDSDVVGGTMTQFLQRFLVGGTNVPPTATIYWDPGGAKASPGSGGAGSWDGSTSDWWTSGSSDVIWPLNGANAVFAGTAGTVSLAALENASSLTFSTTGYTISGSQTLILTSPATIAVSSGISASIQCVLGGAPFTVSGGGTVTLNNAGNYSDGETVIGPNTVLAVATDHDAGNDGVTLNLQSGGMYQDNDSTSGDEFLLPGSAVALGSGGGIFNNPSGNLTMSNWITGSGSLTYTGASSYTLTLTDTANNYTGGTIVAGPGTLKASAAGVLGSTAGSLTVSGGTLNLNGASQSVGAVTISGGTISTGTLTGSSYAGQSGTVSATLAGSAGMAKTTANTLTLSGANTFSGSTTISGGLLQISADDNLGAAPASFVANKISLSGGISNGLRCAGSFTVNANRGISLVAPYGGSIHATSAQTVTFPMVISGGGNLGVGASDTLGYGVSILSGANTYTGTTTIAAGTLRLGANGALPSGTPLTIGADGNSGGGGVLDLNGYSQTIGPLASSTGIGAAGSDTPTIKLTGALTVLQTNVNTTFGGSIINSGGSLTIKVPNGGTPAVLTLNGTNTYTGNTLINGATLALGATGSISNTASMTIAAGATLDVSAFPSFFLSGSTTITAAGTATAATIKGGTTVSLGSQPIALTFDGADPALTISQGALVLNGNTFTVNGSPLAVGTYTLVQQASGSIAASGNFPVNGTALSTPGVMATISVNGGSVLLTVSQTSTTTTLNTLSPSTYGQSVTLTATVSPSPTGGTVQFYDNGAALGGPVNASGGTASYTTSLLAAGSHPITAAYSGYGDYIASSTAGPSTQQVNPAPLSISANGRQKTYGQTVIFGGGDTNFSSSGLQNNETIGSVTLNCAGGAANAPVSGSPYIITANAAVGGTFNTANYTINYNSGLLTVSPATLTVAAGSYSQPYGATNPIFNVAYSNFVNGETLATSDVAGNPVLGTEATTNSPIGIYEITNSIGTLTSTNYSFNLVNGLLTITNAISSNSLTSSENPALPGDAVTFTDTIRVQTPSLATPPGVVQFLIDGNPFGPPVTLSNGIAVSMSTATLSHGYHTNEADYAGNTNLLGSTNTLIELINTPPVANLATFARVPNQDLAIAISALLTNAGDPDGDPLTLSAVSATSTNGAAIATNSTSVIYVPPSANPNVTDRFGYTVADVYGATASNAVVVTMLPFEVLATGITVLQNDSVEMNFSGQPGQTYWVEATASLAPPVLWTSISTNTADANGIFSFTDVAATNYNGRYYRLAAPPSP